MSTIGATENTNVPGQRSEALQKFWERVAAPALSGIADDGELATFLNGQIEQWEIEAARPDPAPAAREAGELLAFVLEVLKLRIRARIGAAERALGVVAMEAA